jgi:hypothetical protein
LPFSDEAIGGTNHATLAKACRRFTCRLRQQNKATLLSRRLPINGDLISYGVWRIVLPLGSSEGHLAGGAYISSQFQS